MTDYSKRIPAAIARGKELLEGRDGWFPQLPLSEPLTAGEVAAVDALWGLHVIAFAVHVGEHDCAANEYGPCQALAAFCEKVEGLNHD